MNLLLVGFGGAFGAICRYLLGVQAIRTFGPGYPWGTYAANEGIILTAVKERLRTSPPG